MHIVLFVLSARQLSCTPIRFVDEQTSLLTVTDMLMPGRFPSSYQ